MTDPSTSSLRVAVSGARGRVGREIVAALEADPGFECVAAVDVDDDLGAALSGASAQVLVDFSVPTAAAGNALTAIGQRVRPLVGTTGIGDAAVTTLRGRCEAAGLGGGVIPNFALGAALLMWLAELCAGHFESCEIIESHHPTKLDAPSGTAARTAELIAAQGALARPTIHSVRLPGLVAHQEVIFGDVGQTLTIRHDSLSRESFMPGVLLAVRRVASLEQPLTVGLEKLLWPTNDAKAASRSVR